MREAEASQRYGTNVLGREIGRPKDGETNGGTQDKRGESQEIGRKCQRWDMGLSIRWGEGLGEGRRKREEAAEVRTWRTVGEEDAFWRRHGW